MKKYILILILGGFLLLLLSSSCSNNNATQNGILEQRIDDLEKNSFTPDFGVFMDHIQLHHSKLWFAGNNENWPLAKYELQEMKEIFEAIKEYKVKNPDTRLIPMIQPPIDSLEEAIAAKDRKEFNADYLTLTNTCNSCHHATGHSYNVIIVPSRPPVTDQQFKP